MQFTNTDKNLSWENIFVIFPHVIRILKKYFLKYINFENFKEINLFLYCTFSQITIFFSLTMKMLLLINTKYKTFCFLLSKNLLNCIELLFVFMCVFFKLLFQSGVKLKWNVCLLKRQTLHLNELCKIKKRKRNCILWLFFVLFAAVWDTICKVYT